METLHPNHGQQPSFADSSKGAMPQVAPNYCVIGVVNDNHLEKGDKVVAGAEAALGAQQLSQGSSGDNSEEEEIEEEEEVETGQGGPAGVTHGRSSSLTTLHEALDDRRRRSALHPLHTLSAAGTTQIDLRQSPPEPRLCLSPFPPVKDGNAGIPPLEAPLEGFKAEKEQVALCFQCPSAPRGSAVWTSYALAIGSDTEGETGLVGW
ncbi:hypothetical protein D9C73_022179 [Collichthys lucidus]|uniref:Uncharacterized protein n=1 Tax=Collichthys lucidus TaxID=240159 RepID=A0A4U5VLL5_COLLU|nr:hypothetical protein D9C73_022179 [Collichthys lucidus]